MRRSGNTPSRTDLRPHSQQLRSRFIVLLLSTTALSAEGAGARDLIGDLGSDVLLPEVGQFMTPVQDLRRQVSLSMQTENVFNRRVGDVVVADVDGHRHDASLLMPFRRAGLDQRLGLRLSVGGFDVTGRSRDPAWNSRLGGAVLGLYGSYAVSRGRHAFSVEFGGRNFDGDQRAVHLERFHHAENDESMNRLFWDLLEPTVSDEIDYAWTRRAWSGAGVWNISLSDADRLGASLRFSSSSSDAAVTYHNTGDRVELRGDRVVDLEQPTEELRIALVYERQLNTAWSGRIMAGARSRSLDAGLVQRDVPVSERGVTIDFFELGAAATEYDRRHLALSATWHGSLKRQATFTAGRMAAEYDGRFDGVTPVLGFTLLALPISHGANGTITGTLDSWVTSVSGEWHWGSLSLAAGVDGSWTELEARSRANAEMEFGLIVTPYQSNRRSQLDLFRLELKPAWMLSRSLQAQLSFRQYIVDVEDLAPREDTQPGVPDASGVATRTRGGLIIGFSLTHYSN